MPCRVLGALLAVLALLAGASACVSPQGGGTKERATAPPPGAKPEPPLAGREEYEKAKQAVLGGDTRGAMELLQQAAKLDAEICEYWYQLGAAESNLAIEVVNQSEPEALRLFAASVDHKREALRLMDLGQCRIWTDSQREQARADGEAGLADADAVMRDPASLVIALKMYAAQR